MLARVRLPCVCLKRSLDQVAKDLGEKYLDDNLVSLLSRHAASCSEAIPPNELASSWRGVLSSRSKAAMLVKLLKQREPAGSSAAQAELQFAAAAVQRVSAEKKAMPPPMVCSRMLRLQQLICRMGVRVLGCCEAWCEAPGGP